jgi:hypothetical protein
MTRKLTPEELARIPVVIRDGTAVAHSSTEQVLKDLRNQGIRLVAMRCDSPHAVKEAVKRNLRGGGYSERRVKEGQLDRIGPRRQNLHRLSQTQTAHAQCPGVPGAFTLTSAAKHFSAKPTSFWIKADTNSSGHIE